MISPFGELSYVDSGAIQTGRYILILMGMNRMSIVKIVGNQYDATDVWVLGRKHLVWL